MKRTLLLQDVCDILVNRAVMTAEQRAQILARQKELRHKVATLQDLKGDRAGHGVSPAEIIAALNLHSASRVGEVITEDLVMSEVGDALGIPYKKINPLELDLAVVTRTFSKAFAVRSLAVPIAIENGELLVAMVNPLDRDVLDDINKVQKLPVRPIISTRTDIVKLIQEFFGFQQSVFKAERELVSPSVDIGNLEQYARLGVAGDPETSEKYIQNAVDYLFRYAFEQRASDIHIEPKRDKSVVRLRIDGVLHTTYSVPPVVHNAMISRIKSLSRLDIAEKRRPQDGRIKLLDRERDVEIRVSTIPVAFGEKAVLRILNPEVLFQDLEQLGFVTSDLLRYRAMIARPHGMILFTGPTGSGKTTSLYSSLRAVYTPEKNITTIEDPIEMVCEDYNQIAVQPAVEVTFSSILRNILRQDPDIIMIGEIRDQDTARNAIQAALTGHLVLSTLHTNDAPSAVTRLLDLGVEAFLVSSTLLGSVAQRLVRLICPKCRETFTLLRDEFEGLGLSLPATYSEPEVQLTRGRGCLQCRKTTYQGREAVFEVMSVTDTVRDLINQRINADEIKKLACREGMHLLKENAVEKILRGRTTYQEVLRCISQAD
ncbi:MAG: type II/IV secretion system protein [Deltaproteobacteria bacterium]|nr:type II/IV secretion system protein [Deltaproteobacteria bacterium]